MPNPVLIRSLPIRKQRGVDERETDTDTQRERLRKGGGGWAHKKFKRLRRVNAKPSIDKEFGSGKADRIERQWERGRGGDIFI